MRGDPCGLALGRHEWRKRAKDAFYELNLVRKRCPNVRKRLEEVEALTSILGEDHDLAMLAREASARKQALKARAHLKMLLAVLEARRKELRTKAFALAEGWYGERQAVKP
jgi:hypothetical protein